MEMLNAVLDEETGKLMKYKHLMKNKKYLHTYVTLYKKELRRLSQGMPGLVKGTDTIFFIYKADVPTAR